MDYVELIIAIGLIFLVTGIYIVIRKFIAWTIEDDNNWHKKQGHSGLSKDSRKVNKKIIYDRLIAGYLLVVALLILYIIKLIIDIA